MNEARQYSYITKEIVEKGNIEIYSNPEDMIKLSEVNLYNQYMKECRQKMKDLHLMRNFYLLINFLMTLLFIFVKYSSIMMNSQDKSVYIKFFVDIILVVIYLAICFVFCIWKGELEFLVGVLSTVALLIIDPLYLFLLVFNFIYCWIYRKKKGSLGTEIGYPLFYEIKIDRIRGKVYNEQRKSSVYSKIENEQEILEATDESI